MTIFGEPLDIPYIRRRALPWNAREFRKLVEENENKSLPDGWMRVFCHKDCCDAASAYYNQVEDLVAIDPVYCDPNPSTLPEEQREYRIGSWVDDRLYPNEPPGEHEWIIILEIPEEVFAEWEWSYKPKLPLRQAPIPDHVMNLYRANMQFFDHGLCPLPEGIKPPRTWFKTR